MRMFGMMAVGLVASWGAPALADDLPPVKKVSAETMDGCRYSIQSQPRQVTNRYGAQVLAYRVSLSRENPYGFCPHSPASVQLYDGVVHAPEVAITSGLNEVVAAYSWKNEQTTAGPGYQIEVLRVNHNSEAANLNLPLSRSSTVSAVYRSAFGGLDGFGDVHLESLTLRSGNLEVRGSVSGNWLSASDASSAYMGDPLYSGSHFVALYPDFFSTAQPPLFATY